MGGLFCECSDGHTPHANNEDIIPDGKYHVLFSNGSDSVHDLFTETAWDGWARTRLVTNQLSTF